MELENFIPFLTVTKEGIIDNHGHKSYLDLLFAFEQKRMAIVLAQDRQREQEDYERAIQERQETVAIEEVIKQKKVPVKHEERLRLYNEGYSDGEIGQIMGKSPATICGWRKKYGLKTKYTADKKYDWDKLMPIIKQMQKEKNLKEIAEELDIVYPTLVKRMEG